MEIKGIIYEILNKNNVEWKENLNAIDFSMAGIDSMLFIQLIVEIEDELGFEFKDEDLDWNLYRTMSDLIEKIHQYTIEK